MDLTPEQAVQRIGASRFAPKQIELQSSGPPPLMYTVGRMCANPRTVALKQMPTLVQGYWNLIRGAKKWLAVTFGLFVLGAIAGVVVGITNPSVNERLLEHPVGPQMGFLSLIFLLKLNLTSTLLAWCTSFILGITPLWITLREGFSTGGLLVYRSPLFGFLSLAPMDSSRFLPSSSAMPSSSGSG